MLATAITMLPSLPAMMLVDTMLDIVTTPATERSMPPVSRANVCPVAAKKGRDLKNV